MPDQHSYTTEEIAKLLKVSKLTVYDLIKKGELPAYRVGRQMRVDAVDLDSYKEKTKKTGKVPYVHISESSAGTNPRQETLSPQQIVITGQDMSLDLFARYLEKTNRHYRPLRSYAGSLDSLIAMYKGEAHIVSTHLFDGDTGEYNLPYIRKILVGLPYIVIRLLARWIGFYVPIGNPKHIQVWEDLKRPDIQIVNRERGSGSRVFLDEQLRLHGISPQEVRGYFHEETNHVSVAGKVAGGFCDAGIGIEKIAQIVGVDFIPLMKERYDLVIVKSPETKAMIANVQQLVGSEEFRNELQAIRGYDIAETGQVIFET
ncbi:helix-turn-helix transcriptional regulator [Fodinisporobacter ferrooxydans]|uniref:Helix-turn-helix transcriptional regulator n=1 Tax=Fodinisporobacter ferrooxydans TaxID=2901836 RepID=A0ABY4CJC2_9BACL|nr:helix-turn-helix transcriptional regulator [Alicyclobacillaceae bacterium MYW30-H2]